MPEQTRSHFQEHLQELEEQALGGLDMVGNTLTRAMEALEHQDVELASMVIADDDRIDGRYLEVHQGILSLLATEAPVATDLRIVAALLHVIKHIERMGDQCVNVAKLIPLSGHDPPVDEQIIASIERMGTLVRSQVAQAKQAFALRDTDLAEDRRQRRGHRRADGVRRHRAVPGVLRRLPRDAELGVRAECRRRGGVNEHEGGGRGGCRRHRSGRAHRRLRRFGASRVH